MKKVFLLSVVLFAFLAACTPNLPVATEEVSTVNPEFFYTVKDTVVKGDNTWNKSIHYFGTGYQWIDIVNNNAFLQKPGRVWRDSKTGTWYCLILPGEVLDMGTKFVNPVFEEDQDSQKGIWKFIQSLPLWLWLIIIAILAAIVGTTITEDKKAKLKKEWNSDPIAAGNPQVPGGVDDQNAHGRMSGLAKGRFPSATIVVKNIQRGHLSGPGEIFYAEGNSKKINLKEVPAYSGEILVNGKAQTIYFLQACGNDARSGNFMSGEEFIFMPDVVINQDGSESPLSQEQNQTQEVFEKDSVSPEQIAEAKKSLEEKAKIAEADLPKQKENLADVELLKVASEHDILASEFLKATNAHKVTLKVTLPSGASVKTILETKIEKTIQKN